MTSRQALACPSFARKLLLVGTLAAASADASAVTIGYASKLDFGNIDYMRLDLQGHSQSIGAVTLLPAAGAFAGDTYSTQYVVTLTTGQLFSIDVGAPHLHLVGAPDIGDNLTTGMHWDPTGSEMYLIAQDDPCTTTTLYVVDVTNAATFDVGSTPRCILGFAIDADGRGFGIDQDGSALASIDIGTGAAATIGPLGIDVGTLIGGLDVDPSTGELNLFALSDGTHPAGRYLVDTAQGTATEVAAYDFAPFGVSLAIQPDTILADGFDSAR
jgi:hypothetical protein